MKIGFISIIILAILFIGSSFIGQLPFTIIVSILAVLSLREMFNLRSKEKRAPAEIELASYIIAIYMITTEGEIDPLEFVIDYRIISVLLFIDFIPLIFIDNKHKYSTVTALYTFGSTVFIGIAFNIFVQLRLYNPNYITYIFLVAFTTDLFSFITGKFIGETMLTTISPRKTSEGAMGGLVMGTALPTMYLYSVARNVLEPHIIILFTLQLSVIGQVGDIVFSYIKREFGKKEFSHVVIGDGGILDVIDCLLFVALDFSIFISVF
ncbi:MAG: phosphatidate cytidylyltransferase [Bacilli bacterium]|nr:phosphatidate cytidylyltransferase [Bacilli bacterium]